MTLKCYHPSPESISFVFKIMKKVFDFANEPLKNAILDCYIL